MERRLHADALRQREPGWRGGLVELRRRRLVHRWRPGSGVHGGWFWRSEVRYSDYSKDVRSESGVAPALNVNFDPVVETATSEIVYKFNWGH